MDEPSSQREGVACARHRRAVGASANANCWPRRASEGGDVAAVRLEADWPALLAELPKLGFVKAVTRNPNAVIEVEGNCDKVEFFGKMGQSVGTIDLRLFAER